MSAQPPLPPHLAARDSKKLSAAAAAGDRAATTTASATKLFLAVFLYILLLLAADASVASSGSPRHLRLFYPQLFVTTVGGKNATILPWLRVCSPANFTAALFSRWLAPGGEPCRDALTTNISIPLLDSAAYGGAAELSAAEIHEFTFHSLDDAGRPRCLGGDYFEVDLASESWKSRPPITDRGDGSYSFRLQVDPRFAGDYYLTIVLLFRRFEGLKFSPSRFKYRAELRRFPIRFDQGNASLPTLEICRPSDFSREVWSGRWTRHGEKVNCDEVDNAGRYRCLDPGFQCEKPWCEGPLGALESSGWVYSAHCAFKIFTPDTAWRCLNGKWIFFWGDSNHVDTVRNLLSFVLSVTDTTAVTRRFDSNFMNPADASQTVRITSVFNGHWNMSKNYLGLQSLQNQEFQQLLRSYFMSKDRVPDVMVLNSGLHDGCYWRSIRAFAQGAEHAAQFWEDVMMDVKARGKMVPRIFYRTTIATGGYARDLAFNPSKMEAYNGVLIEKLRERGLLSGGVIDHFDMTFPWHFDNRCNDGVHYGRAPAKLVWRDGKIGHQYFVDLMLCHVLLNAICNE